MHQCHRARHDGKGSYEDEAVYGIRPQALAQVQNAPHLGVDSIPAGERPVHVHRNVSHRAHRLTPWSDAVHADVGAVVKPARAGRNAGSAAPRAGRRAGGSATSVASGVPFRQSPLQPRAGDVNSARHAGEHRTRRDRMTVMLVLQHRQPVEDFRHRLGPAVSVMLLAQIAPTLDIWMMRPQPRSFIGRTCFTTRSTPVLMYDRSSRRPQRSTSMRNTALLTRMSIDPKALGVPRPARPRHHSTDRPAPPSPFHLARDGGDDAAAPLRGSSTITTRSRQPADNRLADTAGRSGDQRDLGSAVPDPWSGLSPAPAAQYLLKQVLSDQLAISLGVAEAHCRIRTSSPAAD